jgi:DNA polymerase-1
MTDLLKLYKEMIAEHKEENENASHINSKVLLVDGMNGAIRCFAAVPTMNEDGEHIGMISGFLKSVGASIRAFHPTRCVIVFDGPGGSMRRRKMYPEYKEKRKTRIRLNRTYDFKDESEEEASMKFQLITLAQMLRCLPVTVLAIPNVEADDVIAFVAHLIEERGGKSIIMSTDKDFLQIVNEHISVYNPIKKKVYEPSVVVEEYGIHPNNFAIFRALDGDSSDNIPGVRGVGQKAIKRLLPQMAQPTKLTIDEVLKIANSKRRSAICKRIRKDKEVLERNYALMQLNESCMAGTTKMEIVDRLDKSPINLDKVALESLVREHKMMNAFGNFNQWILSTFFPLTRVSKQGMQDESRNS